MDGKGEFACLGAFHAEDGAVEVDVFAAGELGVEAGAYFEQAAHAAVELGLAFGGVCYPGQNFKQCALPRAIPTYDADYFAAVYFEVYIFEGRKGGVRDRGTGDRRPETTAAKKAGETVAQRFVRCARRVFPKVVQLAEVGDFDSQI
jgi:hypothetical protein